MIRKTLRTLGCIAAACSWANIGHAETCVRPAEYAAINILGLQQYLTVVALQCNARPRYEAYAQRFRGDWETGKGHVKAYFDRKYPPDGQARLSIYSTDLANRHAAYIATKAGPQGCLDLVRIFDDVARVRNWNELGAYAAKRAADLPIRSPYFSDPECRTS